MPVSVLWLRRDLRLADHPALAAALDGADALVALFCIDQGLLGGRHRSGASVQFMLECLRSLDAALRHRGARLVVRNANPDRELVRLVRRLDVAAVHATADVGPFARRRDERVGKALRDVGTTLKLHPGLFAVDDPNGVTTSSGTPYTVFTPYHRAWMRAPRRDVLATPDTLPALPRGLSAGSIPELGELGCEQEVPSPVPGGEPAARARAAEFLRDGLARYGEQRDALSEPGTSRLSPYLHFGCISARELEAGLPGHSRGSDEFRRQLCWRDFYAQVLRAFPSNARSEHQPRYRGTLRWSRAQRRFEAWCAGQTGYPLVDAAMRQLRHEGWMHNRARLLVGSFLTKDLAIDWRWGERWFMRWLIDGDEANNNGNWQWIASVGVDPHPPARRMYNPTRQQERFDPEGTFVRRYVPELASVPDEFLAQPWRMPPEVQRGADCVIGRDYPGPIVDHAEARREAIARYAQARG